MKFQLIIDPDGDEAVIVRAHRETALTRQLRELVCGLDAPRVLCAYLDDEIRMLPLCQVECVTVLEGKTYAIDQTGKRYRLKQRLYELEGLPGFIKLNKSTLANEKALVRFTATYSGGINAHFKCGYSEYVSRRCLRQIKGRFMGK